jgi:hypothetical protein
MKPRLRNVLTYPLSDWSDAELDALIEDRKIARQLVG